MIFDCEDDIKIARRASIGPRFSFPGDPQSRAALHPRRNFHGDRFIARRVSLPLALRTDFGDDPSLSPALAAGSADREHPLLESQLSGTAAGRANLGGPPFGARPLAGAARFGTAQLDLRLFSEVGLVEGDRHIVSKIIPALCACAGASSARGAEKFLENVAEDIGESSLAEVKTARSGAGRAGVAEHVITPPLLGVGEDTVGLINFLKLLFGRFITRIPIGMKLKGQLAIGLLQLFLRCVSLDPEDFVVISFIVGHRTP